MLAKDSIKQILINPLDLSPIDVPEETSSDKDRARQKKITKASTV